MLVGRAGGEVRRVRVRGDRYGGRGHQSTLHHPRLVLLSSVRVHATEHKHQPVFHLHGDTVHRGFRTPCDLGTADKLDTGGVFGWLPLLVRHTPRIKLLLHAQLNSDCVCVCVCVRVWSHLVTEKQGPCTVIYMKCSSDSSSVPMEKGHD